MRIFLALLLAIPFLSAAQSSDQNFIKTTIYKDSVTTPITNPTAAQAAVSVAYFDGLGRTIQQIAHRQSTSGKDIIVPVEYDAAGRVTKQYLPYPTGTESMAYNANAVTDAENYYTTKYGATGQNPYSEKILEASPMGRILEQGAPGLPWKADPLSSTDHSIKFDYGLNEAGTGTSRIKLYKATATWNATFAYYAETLVNPSGTVYYAAGQLYKTVIKDENWTGGKNNTTEEYKNMEGQVVLKRTFNVTPHDTYYVYDQFGNLAFVIPPAATGNVNLHMAGHCYQYRYDDKNRLVEKKLPGRDVWEFVVYDRLDRIIATGPAMSPFPDAGMAGTMGWHLTKYDVLNRPVISAWLPTSVTSTTRKTLQGQMDGLTANFSETKSATAITVKGVAFRYTNVAWPATTTYHVLTVNYYDNYDYTGAPTSFSSTAGPVWFNNTSRKPKGMPTGSWVRVLEGSTSYGGELSYSLYDYMGRAVLSKTVNYLGGYLQTENNLDFSGKVLNSYTRHKRLASGTEILLTDTFAYTDQDRLDKHLHKIGTGTSQLMSKNKYEELGQLMNRKTGGQDVTAAVFFQKTDYSYNIRGWLTDINNFEEPDKPEVPEDLFSFRINYNIVEPGMDGTALFNGNISETFWRSASDNVLRKYSYAYDSMNRLNEAIYQKPGSSNPIPGSYNEIITYDANGNIEHIKRTGGLDSADMALQIDDLKFTYDNRSNKLRNVIDYENSSQGFDDDSDGTDDTEDDYEYDAMGNLIMDQNKKIESITYNHLNLPMRIIFSKEGENTISYLYDALGRKKDKIVTTTEGEAFERIKTQYMGGFQYAEGELQFFPTAQGYVRVVDGNYFYIYNMTDHLGNIRLSYTQDKDGELQIIEENHYYPYGLKHQNYNVDKLDYFEGENGYVLASESALQYKYKFNGMELQEELGLNWYDMDFRDYDPAIGRWTGIDPITHHNMSPYIAFDGNPVYWADPSGADSVDGILFSDGAARALFQSILNAMDYFGDGQWSITGLQVPTEVQDENMVGFNLAGSGGGGTDPNKSTSYDGKVSFSYKNSKGEILIGNMKYHEQAARKYILQNIGIEDRTVIWVSHGSFNGINGGMKPQQFHDFLMIESSIYRDSFINRKKINLKLYACLVGQDIPQGFAHDLSKINPYINIYAATDFISYGRNGSDYYSYIGVSGIRSGNINIFNNGQVIGTAKSF